MAAAYAELELAAAVGADASLLAVVVRREEALDGAEARGLHVHGLRRPRERFDVVDRVDDGVPRHLPRDRLQNRARAVVDGRVLEPHARQALDHAAIEGGVSTLVDHGSRVVALEVDRVDAPDLVEFRDEIFRPVARRVELETQTGIEREPALEHLERRRLAESHRDDVGQRPELATDRLAEREPALTEREVESGAFECPPAIVEIDLALRPRLEKLLLGEMTREGVDRPRRPRAGGRGHAATCESCSAPS